MSDLAELQAVLDAEIPMCRQMGIRALESPVDQATAECLRVGMPLAPNQNHQRTAFAGSLNALCTIAGWSATYLALRAIDAPGVIVIRRSAIKYHRPVDQEQIVARCLAPTEGVLDYFAEMLAEKGQAKLDLAVEIASADPAESRPAVAFQGSYVVTMPGE